jgi:hypothetical protein
MATGVGSPDAAQFATALASYTASSVTIHQTSLTASQTSSTISTGSGSGLIGFLTDTTSGQPLGDRRLVLEGLYFSGGNPVFIHRNLVTNSGGAWETIITTKSVRSRFQWFVAFPGDEGVNAALSTLHTVHVLPKLTVKANLRFRRGRYTLRHGTGFTLSGISAPVLSGKRVFVQYRVSGTRRWHTTTLRARVSSSGRYSIKLRFSKPTRTYLRWHYTGSSSGPWLSANSHSKLFVVT